MAFLLAIMLRAGVVNQDITITIGIIEVQTKPRPSNWLSGLSLDASGEVPKTKGSKGNTGSKDVKKTITTSKR
jgi:hypothetical protein